MLEPEAVSVKYEVRDAIGSGGFGVVLEVRDLATNELLAMKKLPFDVDGNDNANIKREIFNIIQLGSHDNIVQWLDIFRTPENQLSIVMERCDSDLAGFLALKANREVPMCFNVSLQILAGVVFLHTHVPVIVHRDIKPQNILMKRNPETNKIEAKIADFGISSSDDDVVVLDNATKEVVARIVYTMKTSKMASGTIPFMGPEFHAAVDGLGLVDGKFHVDVSSDIFALGLVLNFIFCYNDNDYGRKYICTSTAACMMKFS